MKRARWGVPGAVVVLLLAAGGVRADPATELSAREAFASGGYEKARELFAQLYAETKRPIYLRNVGRCHQKLREPQEAIDAYREYLAKAKVIAPDERAAVERDIEEMQALRGSSARAAAGGPASVRKGTASGLLVAQPAAAPTPVYRKWWFWTALGAVAAGAVAALLLAPGGVSRPGCPPDVQGCR
jgi:tetratricopeptide (TPR) repeat protein